MGMSTFVLLWEACEQGRGNPLCCCALYTNYARGLGTCPCEPLDPLRLLIRVKFLLGRAWASPTLAWLHCKDACMCMSGTYVREATYWKFKLNKQIQFCTRVSVRGRLRKERATARLQCWCQRDQERRRSEQTEVRQARLDRRPVRRAAEQPAARQTRL